MTELPKTDKTATGVDDALKLLVTGGANALEVEQALKALKSATGMPLGVLRARLKEIEREAQTGDDGDSVPEAVRAYNDTYFVLKSGGKTSICLFDFNDLYDELTFMTERDFELLERPKPKVYYHGRAISPALAWLEWPGRHTYPAGFHVDASGKDRPGRLNLWRGFAVEPGNGDWPLLRRHIVGVICQGDEAVAEYLLNWCAWVLKNPDKKPGVNINLRGPEGSGKGIFATDVMCRIFGQHARHIGRPGMLTAEFNKLLLGALFVFVDEAVFAGDPRIAGTLKTLTSEGQFVVQPKFVDAFLAKNQMAFMFATNNDHATMVSLRDRRNFSIEVADTYVGDAAYFNALYAEIKNGGRKAFLFDMLARDVSIDDIRYRPETEESALQAELSMRGLDRWIFELLSQEKLPMGPVDHIPKDEPKPDWRAECITVAKDRLFEEYTKWMGQAGMAAGGPVLSKPAFFKLLNKRLPHCLTASRPRTHDTLRVQAVTISDRASCRRAFGRRHGENLWERDDE